MPRPKKPQVTFRIQDGCYETLVERNSGRGKATSMRAEFNDHFVQISITDDGRVEVYTDSAVNIELNCTNNFHLHYRFR